MKRILPLLLALVIILSFAGCQQSASAMDALRGRLQQMDVQYTEYMGELEMDCLEAYGFALVNDKEGEHLALLVYANAEDAQVVADSLAPDGSVTDGNTTVGYALCHYYLAGPFLLRYTGSSSAIDALLTEFFGEQVAGTPFSE